MITPSLLIDLFLILAVAWVLGSVFSRFGLPVMLGELLAGILLGPPLLGIITPTPSIELIADLGVFFVMFYTGLEMDPKELLKHIRPSLAVAVGGFVLPFLLGYLVTKAFGGTLYQSLFVGMGVSITAIAVQSVILQSMQIHKTSLGHIIIGAAIADDILCLMAMAVLLNMARTGTVQLFGLSWIIIKVVIFFGFTFLLGQFVIPKITEKLHDREGKAFTFALLAAIAMAYLAEKAGLHYIIGAFLAGQFIRKEMMDDALYSAISDRFFGMSYGFLVPVFFASLSFHLHFYKDWDFALLTLSVTVVAVLGKLLGSGLGLALFRRNFWECVIVGFGMNGRGAVELVVASVVLKLSVELMAAGAINEPLLTDRQFSALIVMAFFTTLIAPITLKYAVKRTCQPDEKTAFCSLWEESSNK